MHRLYIVLKLWNKTALVADSQVFNKRLITEKENPQFFGISFSISKLLDGVSPGMGEANGLENEMRNLEEQYWVGSYSRDCIRGNHGLQGQKRIIIITIPWCFQLCLGDGRL